MSVTVSRSRKRAQSQTMSCYSRCLYGKVFNAFSTAEATRRWQPDIDWRTSYSVNSNSSMLFSTAVPIPRWPPGPGDNRITTDELLISGNSFKSAPLPTAGVEIKFADLCCKPRAPGALEDTTSAKQISLSKTWSRALEKIKKLCTCPPDHIDL